MKRECVRISKETAMAHLKVMKETAILSVLLVVVTGFEPDKSVAVIEL